MRCTLKRTGADAVAHDLVNLLGRVAEVDERWWDRRVDDLEVATTSQLLKLDEREVGLNARRVAVHHETDRAGRGDQGHLRITEAVHLAQGERAVGLVASYLEQFWLADAGVDTVGHHGQALVLGGRRCVGRATMVAHDAQHVVLVAVVGVECPVLGSQLGAGRERGEVHDRADCATEGHGLRRVVRDATLHREGAEVGVAQSERAVEVRTLSDLAAWELCHQHGDLEHDRPEPTGMTEEHVIEVIAAIERHQVHRSKVASRVVKEDVLGAGVRGHDRSIDRARVPLVGGVVELDARIGAQPSCLADLIPQVAGSQHLAGLGVALLLAGARELGAVVEWPIAVGLDGLHKGIGDADGVVRVLAGDGQIGLALPVGVVLVDLEFLDALLREIERALDRGVGDAASTGTTDGLGELRVVARDVARIAFALLRRSEHGVEVTVEHSGAGHERSDLGLFDNLPADVLLDVGMVEIERDHLRSAARRATGLDRTSGAVTNLEEAHQTRRATATGETLLRTTQLRKVRARARAVLEDARLADPEVHDATLVDEVVVDGLDKAGVRRRALVRARRTLQFAGAGLAVPMPLSRSSNAVGPVQAGVEPLRRVRRGDLQSEHRLQLVAECERAGFVKVVVCVAPVGPAAGKATEDLARVVLADKALVFWQGGQCVFVGLVALQPGGHAVFMDRLQLRCYAGFAAVLLRENIDGNLAPTLGCHDRRLERDGTIGVDDARRSLDEGNPIVRVVSFGGVSAFDVHRVPPITTPRWRLRNLVPAVSRGMTNLAPPSDRPPAPPSVAGFQPLHYTSGSRRNAPHNWHCARRRADRRTHCAGSPSTSDGRADRGRTRLWTVRSRPRTCPAR